MRISQLVAAYNADIAADEHQPTHKTPENAWLFNTDGDDELIRDVEMLDYEAEQNYISKIINDVKAQLNQKPALFQNIKNADAKRCINQILYGGNYAQQKAAQEIYQALKQRQHERLMKHRKNRK
ncbi:hypothetical protein BEN30_15070 [Magnetovibrio blakemorei]|uniref:Uncharacterized protein n=2 Tax=Magnetovibrio blakemorei TaxID=28181 RepID=A0A1E5Q4Q9_9PROT|nr:hypothetical protein BEN30_15070 [Magnetovibrio blakemorei]